MASTVQLVCRNGEFNEDGLGDFVRRSQLPGLLLVVAIIGPQSSGKSTLLNCLFGTNFVEMDASKGRRQTTQGVWLAKADGLEPCTLVMDFEGSDGVERGEDDTLFERQVSLFALAVSDIMLINMWYTDIGREKAAGRPLLKTVFEVMTRRLRRRKMTLMFVIRDVSYRVLPERLESDLLEDLEKLWKTVKMPSDLEGASLQKFFDVKVTLLSNFEDRKLEFDGQVAKLRNGFQNSTERGGLAGDRSNSVPGTAFSLSTKKLWQMIKENKDLDLPSHRVMVATVRCDQITKEKLQKLQSHRELLTVKQNASKGIIEGFGKILNALVEKCSDEYAAETEYLDENTKNCKLESFISEVWNLLRPSYSYQIKYLQDQALSEFKRSFDTSIKSSKLVKDFLPNARQAVLDLFNRGREDARLECEPSKEKGEFIEASNNLSEDINAYVLGQREAKHSESMSSSKKVLEGDLAKGTGDLLAEAGKSADYCTWPVIRNLVETAVAEELSRCEHKFSRNFDPTEEEMGMMRKSLEGHGKAVVKEKVKAGIPHLPLLLMDRFTSILTHDPHSGPRQWVSEDNDIPAIVRGAKSSSLRLLTMYAVIKLDENNAEVYNAGVDFGCLSALVPDPESRYGVLERRWNGTQSPEQKRDKALLELSRGTVWRNISKRDTLITPSKFKSMWNSFENQTRGPIDKVIKDKEEAERGTRKTFFEGVASAAVAMATTAAAAAAAVAMVAMNGRAAR